MNACGWTSGVQCRLSRVVVLRVRLFASGSHGSTDNHVIAPEIMVIALLIEAAVMFSGSVQSQIAGDH